ncbi:type VI secretion system tube protein Hcp [Microbacterium sp. 4R-513]|uniref:Hcp family type VI secretion system effector n=1 Tax=Microbacterium sp. 4R-513 TaxID=2567934 RepID=UPI0013E17ACC|nr:type VI secretion system tube protein Hcp [Microbacterium sp. 4R-513]QIG39277.1 type VI secretion system tube protein Hcp [Microbacterium sp. 4R-513]
MAVDTYLQLPGIPGDSVERDHRDWIPVTGVTWGVEQAGGIGAGAGGGAGRAGRTTQHPLIVSAPTSIASPLLFEAVAKGAHLATARLEVVRANEGRGTVIMRWEFEDVRVTRLDIAGASVGYDDAFELVAKRVRLSVLTVDERGGAGQPVTRGWDFATHQAW